MAIENRLLNEPF